MATWEALTVRDAVNRISDNLIVLPVIQRRLVWDETKMELLFDTLLKRDSFGGIMVIEEERGQIPMFAYRLFSRDATDMVSVQDNTPWSATHLFIIDGQQRLQSFYIGLVGLLNGKQLFFNVATDPSALDFDFRFAANSSELPKKTSGDDERMRQTLWLSVPALFQRLGVTNDDDQVVEEVLKQENITDEEAKNFLTKNLRSFFKALFVDKAIGISKVAVNRTIDQSLNKQRIVELFRRLNDGGTRLSSFDLIASILKGFEWEMEAFLDRILSKYKQLSIGQDELIKLIFILEDQPRKEVSEIAASDAQFATQNRARIEATLEAVEKFLHASNLIEYFREPGRSIIPLYFIAYHFFHKSADPEAIRRSLDRFDVKNRDFRAIYRWLVFSILSNVFRSRGAGWIPYKTGLRKISAKLRDFKGKVFPYQELFDLYLAHPLRFFSDQPTETTLESFDKQFLFYLLYNGTRVVRQQDVDHVHPQHLLLKRQVPFTQINSFQNLQLLDSGTNRNVKNGLELGDWIEKHVEEPTGYIARHLIPANKELWRSKNFDAFCEQRQRMMIEKLRGTLDV
jgi:Protein of unknown function DUF262